MGGTVAAKGKGRGGKLVKIGCAGPTWLLGMAELRVVPLPPMME